MTRTKALLVVGCIMLALAVLAALELRQEVTEPSGQAVTGLINKSAPPAQTLAEPQRPGALVPLDQGTLRSDEFRPAPLPDQMPSGQTTSSQATLRQTPERVEMAEVPPAFITPPPVKPEPMKSEQGKPEPIMSTPKTAEPVQAKSEPVIPEPVKMEPEKTEATRLAPVAPVIEAEPKKTEQAKPEPTKPEQTKLVQPKPEPAKPEQSKPEQNKTEQSRSEQTKPEQAKPETVKPELDKTTRDEKGETMRAIDTAGPISVEKGQKAIVWTRLELADKSAIFRLSGAEKVEGKAFALPDPDRFVVDLQGDWVMRLPEVPKNAFIKQIRVGKYGTNTRLVLDLSRTRDCQMVRINPTTLEFRIR